MTGMGLRGRLALYFVAITVVPLAVAAVALQLQNAAQQTALVQREVGATQNAALLAVRSLRGRAGDAATDLGLAAAPALAAGNTTAATRVVAEGLQPPLADRADFLVLAGADGLTISSTTVDGTPEP